MIVAIEIKDEEQFSLKKFCEAHNGKILDVLDDIEIQDYMWAKHHVPSNEDDYLSEEESKSVLYNLSISLNEK